MERNPLRANLVARSADWPWGSLAARASGGAGGVAAGDLLDEWPVPRPPDWDRWVDEPGSEAELEALRQCGRRGRPGATGSLLGSREGTSIVGCPVVTCGLRSGSDGSPGVSRRRFPGPAGETGSK